MQVHFLAKYWATRRDEVWETDKVWLLRGMGVGGGGGGRETERQRKKGV